ncbi:MAG: alpha/beta hydrolase [Bacteroidota bacterium]
MKKFVFFAALILSFFSVSAQSKQEHYAINIKKFQRFYNEQNADSIYSMYSEQLGNALSLAKTKEMVNALQGQIGKLNSYTLSKETAEKNIYTGNFEKMTLSIVLALNEKNELAGLLLQPVKTEEEKAVAAFNNNFNVATNKGDSLFGTLLMPKSVKGKPNIVLIIAGSGPTDRDGNSVLGVNANSYKMLADSLSNAGIASVRYDKRGVAESAAAMTSETEMRFDDGVNDAILFVKKIKVSGLFAKIYIAGHSEGSLVGMLLATKEKVDGFISISGAGENSADLLRKQLKANAPQIAAEGDKILNSLLKGNTVNVENKALAEIFRPTVQPYLISWFAYNPQVEIKKLNIPILIIQGNTDLQVGVSDAQLLSKAQPKARLVIIDQMNHALKTVGNNREENLATYGKPELPIDSDFSQSVIDFCRL